MNANPANTSVFVRCISNTLASFDRCSRGLLMFSTQKTNKPAQHRTAQHSTQQRSLSGKRLHVSACFCSLVSASLRGCYTKHNQQCILLVVVWLLAWLQNDQQGPSSGGSSKSVQLQLQSVIGCCIEHRPFEEPTQGSLAILRTTAISQLFLSQLVGIGPRPRRQSVPAALPLLT